MRKGIICLLINICLSTLILGQNTGLNVYTPLYSQPSYKLNIKLVHRVVESKMLAGQPFCCKIKNLTNNQLQVTFNLVAITICGNEVVGGYDDIIIEPNETINQCGDFSIALNNYIVTEKDCAGEAGSYTSNGKIYNGINRIRSVKIENLEVKEIVKDNRKGGATLKANDPGKNGTKKSSEELSDDEKLNRAMMAKLEKDFDNERKPKKEKTADVDNSKAISDHSNVSKSKSTVGLSNVSMR